MSPAAPADSVGLVMTRAEARAFAAALRTARLYTQRFKKEGALRSIRADATLADYELAELEQRITDAFARGAR